MVAAWSGWLAGSSRGITAQVAIVVGDDDEAREMLSAPGPDPLDEGDRLRILGDLDVRRGRVDEGVENPKRAKRIFEDGDWDVDAANCDLHLIEAQLGRGDRDFSAGHLDGLLDRVGGIRGDNYAGLSRAASKVGRAHAAMGDVARARELSERAFQWALPTEAPALIALAHRSKAAVAQAAGDVDETRHHLEEARDLLSGVDAWPEADKVAEDLENLTG